MQYACRRFALVVPPPPTPQLLQPRHFSPPMAPTRNKSSPPEQDPSYIPRPPNCFILYRAEKLAQFREQAREVPGCSPKDTRKLISKMWQEEPEEVVEYWKQVAEQRAIEHQKTYPNYRFRPKKKKRSSAAPLTFEIPKKPIVPLLPVPAPVPSSVPIPVPVEAVPVERRPVVDVCAPPTEPASGSHSDDAQECTIISPSFIRPSPNFSFLSLDDLSEFDSTPSTPALSPMPQISLPLVPSIPVQAPNMYTLPQHPAERRVSQPFDSRFSPSSSIPLIAGHHHYIPRNPDVAHLQSLPSGVPTDPVIEIAAPPIVPSQGTAPWDAENSAYSVATRSALLDPASSAFGHAAPDSCLLDMVSNLLFLPENVLSSFHF